MKLNPNKFLIFDIDVKIVEDDRKEYEFISDGEKLIFKELALIAFKNGRFTFFFRRNYSTPDIIAHEVYHAFFLGLLEVGDITSASLSDEIYALQFEDLYSKVYDKVQKKLSEPKK